ncbi:hypothetical protein BGZ67_009606 [Mortierella alpina]|nr:hypothetical protein BGZ67_009606 [Mortierella alpina]
MSSNSHNHNHNHGHSHGHGHGQDDLSKALSASVLPVATTTPGASVAHSLATPAKSSDIKTSGVSKVIVVFKDNTPASEIANAISEVESQGGKITHRYESALLGFAAELPDSSVQTMSVHPHVSYVEADGVVSAYAENVLKKN